MLSKPFWLATILATQVACASEPVNVPSEGYHYRADFFSAKSGMNDVTSRLSFIGSEVHRTDTDVIHSFDGCSKKGSSLKLKSSLAWLEFEIDLEASPKGYDKAGEGELIFIYDSIFLGEKIKILGIKRDAETFTVAYYSPSKGMLGLALLSRSGEPFGGYIQPIYWLEGGEGICQESEM